NYRKRVRHRWRDSSHHLIQHPKRSGGTTAAYAVFIRETTRDPSALNAYTPKAAASMAGHAMKVLAAYGRQEVLEGPAVEGMVIVQFPSMAEAKAWYDSPAYRDAREHRFRGADYRAVLVEGV